jgi:uncharacterized membrane protein YqjE
MNEYNEETTVTTEPAPEPQPVTQEPISELLKDLRDESIVMIRQQFELARAETTEKISKLGRNIAFAFAGSLVAYAGVLFLLLGLNNLGVLGLDAAGLSEQMAAWIMPLIVGLIIGLIGYGFVRKAISTFKHTSVMPRKTVQSIKEDRQWLASKQQQR